MLKRIIDAIKGKQATLDLSKATVIFQEAKGKFSADANKAVPFAIMATARALGAEVTLFVEGREKASELESTRNAVVAQAITTRMVGEEDIEGLKARIAEIDRSIKAAEVHAQSRAASLDEEKQAVVEVVDFFTV